MKGANSRNLVVRPAATTDLDMLVRFSAAMAFETEGRRLDQERLRRGTLAVLEFPRHGFYVVAERPEGDGQGVVGQLLITYEWSDWRNAGFWWIQSVYVDPDWRRRGVYRAMHQYILEMARARTDVCGVRLYVERENGVAQSVYERLNLRETNYRMWEVDFVLEP